LDPIAHTFTGAALAASGLRRATPLATAALVIGANAPDVDVLTSFAGSFTALALRRGWTHGLLAIVLLPLVVTGLLLLWDRFARRAGSTRAARPRAGPLLGVAALGVITHPTLDWLNNYGMRWLMPFDGRWFYGDALFIIDPWIWLTLGGVLFLGHSRRVESLALWGAFWLIASLLVLSTPLVPTPARALWIAGVAVLLAARGFGFAARRGEPALERATGLALVVVAAYITAAVLASGLARSQVRAALAASGIGPVQRVMVGPAAANPFGGEVVAQTPTAYYVGRWRWLARPRFVLAPAPIPRMPPNEVLEAAARTPAARRFLIWSRFPYYEVESSVTGHVVRLRDARYGGTGRLDGPTVSLDPELRLVGTE
jgi:inner membrane protein